VLHGRTDERARLAELIANAHNSLGGALVVRGEPGVGKTALLTDLAAHTSGMTVLHTQGIESESPLPFAALQRLLRPVMSHLEHIPASQVAALRSAFGAVEGTATDRFVVFVAALSVLAEAAETMPVLCIVDDAHWLDAASAEALMFVARRLQADRIAIVFGAREGDVRRFDGTGLPDLLVGGIDADAAAALLTERAGGPVSDAVRDELMVRTGGNPLALVELPAVLSDSQLTGEVRLPAQLPLTQGVERAFLDRCRRLPADSQTLLLVAAADDSGRVAVVQQAAALLGADANALELAERSGLIRVASGELVLRHTLVRSAVYAAATTGERQRSHRALAQVLTAAGDVDRRTWHLSLATDEPDEALATALDLVADRAAQRAGHEAAGAASERAAELSEVPDARARRLFAAATSGWLAGDMGRARARAERAIRYANEPLVRADIERLRGRLEWNVGSLEVGQRIVMDAAVAVAGDDSVRALEMAMLATTLATFATAPAGTEHEFVPTLVPNDPPRLHCFAALLEGHQRVQAGRMAEATESLRRALTISQQLEVDTDLLANLGIAAFHLGDDATAESNYARLLVWARERGAVSVMVSALARLPFAQIGAGRWEAARASAGEAADLARGIGQLSLTAFPLSWLALLAALRGDPTAEAMLEDVEHLQAKQSAGVLAAPAADVVAWTRATLAANAHDLDGALHHLGRLTVPMIQRLAAIDRVEAAVKAGAPDLAHEWSRELTSYGDAVGARWATAAGEHGLALVTAGAEAEAHFVSALGLHEHAGRPVGRARTHLAYGEFLRRSRRRVDARVHLRAALEVFDDVGAGPWAERARQELRASGETARKRDVSTTEDLTPQELQTARLVAQGLSNREVAERLFVSPRTVEYHLSNAYQKLAVRSRGELAQLTLA
jgi:DNA-binding CsgD family transcriptional regulator